MTAVQFTSPVGRMVQGDLFAVQTTDNQGKPLVYPPGHPKAGQTKPQWFAALAFQKGLPDVEAFIAMIRAEGAKHWPNLYPQGPYSPSTIPLSLKIVDGDGYDTQGKSNASKEGFAGHWVVRFSSGFAPKVFPTGRYTPADQIQDATLARRGYYYRFVGTIDTNANPQKPGVYVNLSGAELMGYGPEIVGGPDFAAAFGAAGPAALPPGASALPTGASAAPAPAPVMPAPPPATQAPPPPAAVQPHYAPMAPPPAPAAPPPPQPVRRMTAKAAGATRESFIAAGWTEDAMIAQGYMEDFIPF